MREGLLGYMGVGITEGIKYTGVPLVGMVRLGHTGVLLYSAIYG